MAAEDALGAILARAVAERATSGQLPADLRARVERLSGLSMDDVRVTYDSAQPARLNARAFARGTDIHLGPGADSELAHETWHVVQQKRGKVAPNASVAGEPANADPALEREADRMAAESQASAPASTHAGAPPDTAPRQHRQPHLEGAKQPVVQGRWLIVPETRYFWEEEAGVGPEDVDAPDWLWERHVRCDALKPGTYVVNGGRGARGKGMTLVHTIDDWATIKNLGKAKAPSDNYNPFGRFASGVVNSFIPAPGLSDSERASLMSSLATADASFREPAPAPTPTSGSPDVPRSPGGYRMEVMASSGEALRFVEETPFGAVYAQTPPPAGDADYNRSRAKDSSALRMRPAAEDYKLAQKLKMTSLELRSWSGAKRSRSQDQVMSGVSAGDAADNAGFVKGEGKGWEWLHLIAHSMGGIEGAGPQVQENLVAGTSECNTHMIVAEEFIKDQVVKSDGMAAVSVNVRMFDRARHIADKIGYDAELYNGAGEPVAVYHWLFSALSRRQPLVAVNRASRYTGRELHPDGGTAATTHIPRSVPTAHTDYDPSHAYDAIVDGALEIFRTRPAADFIAHLKLILAKPDAPGNEIFDDLGGALSKDQLPEYLRLLHAGGFLAPVLGRVVRSFTIDHPDTKASLLRDILVPLFHPAAVPASVGKYCV